MQQFATAFAVDLLGFSILSNHFHLILLARPDFVATWDDREVARRWLLLCPLRRSADSTPMPPTEAEINSIAGRPVKRQEIRSRLSRMSWWMRLLLDEGPSAVDSMDKLRGSYDSFLSPLSIHELIDPIGPCVSETDQRCGDEGVLAMPLDDYLELLDWTARQVAPRKRGSTPKNSPPILERLGLDQSSWCELVSDFGRLFCLLAGTPASVDAMRSHRTHRRYPLRRRARELFATDRSPDGVPCNSSSLPPSPSNERIQKIPKEIHWQP